MGHLGIDVPALGREPPRSYARVASAIWLGLAVPFFVLAWLHADWRHAPFAQWRGWVFGAAALGCVLMATVVPPRYRLALVGTRVRAWGPLL